jgi:hypothetical protein
MEKKIFFIYSIISILVVFLFIFFYPDIAKNKLFSCSDGTLINECSLVKPYLCLNEKLVEKSSICGCFSDSTISGDKCISRYQTNQKNISLEYVLNGKKDNIEFSVYEGAYNYISQISSFIDSKENPSLLDFRLKNLNEPVQKEFLYPLILAIQKKTSNKQDQMRIAISIVQNIPFGNSPKSIRLGENIIPYQRKAYEVLYDFQGVCSEKSELLIFLLRGLGYDTSFVYFSLENHEAVGIKCPEKFSIQNTSYCFIETTGPSILTDDQTEYIGNRRLKSFPTIIKISEGESLKENLQEFSDAKILIGIREDMKKYGEINFIQHFQFKQIKKEYGLPDFTSYTFN